ncbi:cytochrome P450 [Trametes cingulata]|nr:cytochrome P450 [Trametes cingulata]
MLDLPSLPSCIAAAAGAASWSVLHRLTVRGDHALVFFSVSLGVLYIVQRCMTDARNDAIYATATLASVYFSVLSAITITYRVSPWHPLASYPGPLLARLSSLWLTAVSFTGRRHLILDRLHAKYGPFVRIGPNAVSMNTLAAIPLYNHLEKGESYRFPNHDDVVSIFLKQDSKEGHRERRRIWGGLFTPSSISDMTPALERRTWQLMRCLEERQSTGDGYVDLTTAFYHWSYDLGGDMVFSDCNEIELMRTRDVKGLVATGKFSTAMMDTFGQSPWLLDILWRIPATKDMHQLVRMTAAMAHKRVESKEQPTFKDLVSYLMEGGVPMCDLERDAMIAILAASENTTITIALAFCFLIAEPVYYKQLQTALDQAFPDPLGALTPSALAALPLLDGIINESLRLGSLFFLPRLTPPGGVEVDGKYIPENTTVALAAYSIQTSADYFFPEPMSFRPERWTPEGLGPLTKTNRTALAAFSYGQHSCLGKTLAYQQMRFVLARLVLAYDMEFKPGFDVHKFREGILGMGTPHFEETLYVRFTRRPGVHLDDVCAK